MRLLIIRLIWIGVLAIAALRIVFPYWPYDSSLIWERNPVPTQLSGRNEEGEIRPRYERKKIAYFMLLPIAGAIGIAQFLTVTLSGGERGFLGLERAD